MMGPQRTRIAEWADLVDAEVPERAPESVDADPADDRETDSEHGPDRR